MQKLQSVQVLRGVAATAVVACHMTGLPLGSVGVDLFFVISGFVIGKVMDERAAGDFLRDRLWRIFPIYWLCALPWIVLAWHMGDLQVEKVVATITLWPIYDRYTRPYLLVAWSLCFEMLFYVAATVSLATGKGRWLIAAFLAFFAVNLIAPSPLAGFLGNPLIFNFLFGLAITRLPLNERVGRLALVLGLAIIPFVSTDAFGDHALLGRSDATTVVRVLGWGVPSAMIVYGAISLERFSTSKVAILLGDASYSIYLTHLLVAKLMEGIVAIPVAIVFGIAVHLWVEKPLLRARGSRPRAPLPAVQPLPVPAPRRPSARS